MLAVYRTIDNIIINTNKPEEKGSWIDLTNPTEDEIALVTFRYIKQTRSYHSVFRLFEVEEGFELTEVLGIHFMELPKLLVKWREGLG